MRQRVLVWLAHIDKPKRVTALEFLLHLLYRKILIARHAHGSYVLTTRRIKRATPTITVRVAHISTIYDTGHAKRNCIAAFSLARLPQYNALAVATVATTA